MNGCTNADVHDADDDDDGAGNTDDGVPMFIWGLKDSFGVKMIKSLISRFCGDSSFEFSREV